MNEQAMTQFLNPPLIVKQADVKQGEVVADFGCGAGYFSLACAQAVGTDGTVTAFDILPQALESVESRAKVMHLSNITTKRVNLEKERGSGLEDGSMNWVVMKDMLFQNKDKKSVLAEAYRVLRHGGKALIVEWKAMDATIGPAKDTRIGQEDLTRLVHEIGFTVGRTVDAGPYHYSFIAEKE